MGDRVWRRLLKVDPSLTERHITHLLGSTPPRPLPAAKYLLSLARKASKGSYQPMEGKSPYQMFVDFLELAENFADDIGLDAEEADQLHAEAAKAKQEAEQLKADEAETATANAASVTGKLIRFEGKPVPLEEFKAKSRAAQQQSKGKKGPDPEEPYDEDTDAGSLRKLDIEKIVKQDGLEVYKDQAGRLWSGLATYWIKRGEFDQATATFEAGIASVVTIRDFSQIFDAYAEFSETLISSLMTAVSDPDMEDEPEELADAEEELDKRMKDFEELMDRRPFLVNEVLLRRNPSEVVEWEKRVALYGDDDVKVRRLRSAKRAIERLLTSAVLYRSSRRTTKRWKRSTLEKPSVSFIPSTSTMPNSMKKVDPKTPRRGNREARKIWLQQDKSLRKQSEFLTRMLMSLPKSGVNGQRWRSGMRIMIRRLD